SMGAIVGAALAAGTFDRLLTVVNSMDVGETASLFLDFSFTSSGLVKGQKVVDFLSKVIPDVSFDELEIPFVALATDIESGKAVPLKRGRVLSAVRASIAIPGLFTPVRRGQYLLVDGGLSSPVPIDAVRSLGVGAVIAVNVDVDAKCPYDTHRLPSVVNRAMGVRDRVRKAIQERFGLELEHGLGFMNMLAKTTRICERRIASWEVERSHPEFLIEPPVGDIPTLDFSRVDDAVRAGYEEATRRFNSLASRRISHAETQRRGE
ncbi:MAG: patatin-like phospholipase family protein, partial [Kiritimatiellae bacterium]|nr:patatin-like phospholipase family protein [Kiritimatiellia bacterium]